MEVGPLLVKVFTCAQLTDDAPAEVDPAVIPTATMLDIVAAANRAALNFLYATCTTSPEFRTAEVEIPGQNIRSSRVALVDESITPRFNFRVRNVSPPKQ
jgi:hypothetical protein